MQVDFEQVELAKSLERHELALASLYEVYKRKFPTEAAFWEDIILDERSHAFMMKTIRTMIEDGKVAFAPRPYSARTIDPYILDLNRHAEDAMKSDLELSEALMAAMELESRVVEKDLYRSLAADAAELKQLLNLIQSETQGHFARIKAKLDEVKGR